MREPAMSQGETKRLSYVHRGGDQPLIGETIDSFVAGVARRFGNREAIVSLPQERRLAYRELDAHVDALARGLMAQGVVRGDRVGVWSTDNAEWIILQLATARIGAVLVNVNPAYRTAELEHALRLARVQVLFLIPAFRSSRYPEMVCELCPEAARLAPGEFSAERLPDLTRLVVWDPDAPECTARPARGFTTWQEVIASGEAVSAKRVRQRRASLDPDDPINIQFTSGTTGFPKAVVLTHHNIVNNAYFVGEAMEFGPEDRLCVPVPFYHCFGMVVSNLACLTHGAAIVIPAPHFEAGATLAAIQRERCTALHGVPTMFIAELERPDFSSYDLSTLRTGIMAGAPCAEDLVRRVIDEMGCEHILIGYGLTEASPVTHVTRPEDSVDKRVATVGTNLPHQEVKIVDPESGAMLPAGEQGEIQVRGYHVMRGYFGDERATAQAIDEAGWLHTGDLGALDRDDYLRITGRIKDMIIRGGENIYPAEIEVLFHRHPQVADVAVFGVPDAEMGEEVGAWIQLREGEVAEPEDFREYAVGKIAHFKIPRYVWIVEEFPMTVTGKIQKFRIREIVADWLNGEADGQASVSRAAGGGSAGNS